jgi:hypothetical protein
MYPRRLISFGARIASAALVALSASSPVQSASENVPIESLLEAGWQVAGFSTGDNRSALLLLKHPSEPYLVQCLTGYDVTRTPRVVVNCYQLH